MRFKTITWACIKCKWKWDVVTLMDGTEQKEQCLKCQSNKTKQVITAPPVVFKGTGFHDTDYD